MRASGARSVFAVLPAALLLVGCGEAQPRGTSEGIARAIRDYTAAEAAGDSNRFCSSLTERASAAFADTSETSPSTCVEVVEAQRNEVRAASTTAESKAALQSYQRFLDGLRVAAADERNLRISRRGVDAARVEIHRRGNPTSSVDLLREDGDWKVDQFPETATLR